MTKHWKVTSCIRCDVNKPHVKNGFHYTYCDPCLREAQLGPNKKRRHLFGEEYLQW